MLLAYGGRNCWGFREWVNISFRVAKSTPSELSFSEKHVVPAMCFEGANASGKTCALRILSFIYDFCLNSFLYPIETSIKFDTFYHNNERSNFYILFCLGNDYETEYCYEVEMDKQKIYSERITKKTDKKWSVILSRKDNRIMTNKIFQSQTGVIYKSTASVISTLLQYDVKEMKPFGDFFKKVNSNVSYGSTIDDPMTDYAAKYYHQNPSLHNRVVRQLKLWDTGISDVEIREFTDIQGKNIYASVFHHGTGKDLLFSSESNGTKLLYNRLKDFFMALDTGGVLIYDELDTHLHFEIVPYLLNFFTDFSVNKNHAQIIFSSHATELLDILKKYRAYLFKKIQGESICYRIDELRGNNLRRNDRSLEQLYKAGLLGGLPDVGQP